MDISSTVELESVGRLCGLFQRSPKAIREAATKIGIEPPFVINGVAHFTPDQAERIASFLLLAQQPREYA